GAWPAHRPPGWALRSQAVSRAPAAALRTRHGTPSARDGPDVSGISGARRRDAAGDCIAPGWRLRGTTATALCGRGKDPGRARSAARGVAGIRHEWLRLS